MRLYSNSTLNHLATENSQVVCGLGVETGTDHAPLLLDIDGHCRTSEHMSCDPTEMDTEKSSQALTVGSNDIKTDLIVSTNFKKKMATPDAQSFDADSFKKSFLFPKLNVTKKKNLPKERLPTVITSEAWKEIEQKKLLEKERLEAEKDARKVEREQKKILAAQLKVEKEMAKEKKKMEKAEKAEKDAKKKKRVGSKKKKL